MSQSTKNILLGRFASLESDAGEEISISPETVDEDGAQLDGTAIAEGDMVEAAADEAIVTEATSDTDELLEASESLESFLYAAQLANKQGAGWTRPEATAYAIGIANVLRPLGLGVSSCIPSMESFGGSRERINSTISVENAITGMLKDIWTAIKNSINKLVTYVRNWYLKVVEGTARLKKRAEAIKEKASGKTGSPTEQKIKISFLGKLHIAKAMPSSAALIDSIGEIDEVLKALTSDRTTTTYGDGLDSVTTVVEDLLDGKDDAAAAAATKAAGNVGGSNAAISKITSLFTETLDGAALAAIYPAVKADDNYIHGKATKQLPGGKKLVVVYGEGTTEIEASANAIKNNRIDIRDFEAKKVEVDSSKDVKTLAPGEVVAIAEKVIGLCDTVIGYKAQYANYERKTKEFLSKMDRVSSKSASGDDATVKDRTAKARLFANAAASMTRNEGTAITHVIGYGVGLCRDTLAYANNSLGQYKG